MDEPRGRYSRGYLPHIDAGEVAQFITFRLADSLPAGLVEKWRQELSDRPSHVLKKEIYSRIEKHLDSGHGSCLLERPSAANAVQETLLACGEDQYHLHEWVVMPNHVHVLLTPRQGVHLAKIVQSVKGRSAKRVNESLGRTGRLWQPDYFDRLIRDESHFDRVAKYITWNPVKAKLCNDPTLWPHSSACPRFSGIKSAD